MYENLVICYGALRSGSTVLRLMIDAHPQLRCPGETDFLFEFLEHDEDGEWRYRWNDLAADRIFRASHVSRPSGLDGVAALEAMIDQIPEDGESIPVLMVHRHFERVAELFPDTRVIHLKRDPRDVARSCIGMGWAGNVYCGIDRWISTERAWEAAAGRMAREPMDLYYESLITNPDETLRTVCAYIGVEFDAAMLSYPERTTYSAPDPSLVFQWKRKQTREEVGLIEGRLGDMMERYGYERSSYPPVRPGFFRRIQLRASSKIAVWRGMSRRYGLATVLQRGIGRRLGLTRMKRSAQARIDAITVRNLK